MQRINKNTASGNAIIDRVLALAWSTSENRYEGALYYGLIDNQSRTTLIGLFLAEQNGLCCYCLKEIGPDDVAIEHIIPQGATQQEINKYITVQELSNSLIHKDLFIRTVYTIPPIRYPHDLCYNNLIASCVSTSHCNHERGKKYISPIMYDTGLINALSYEPSGSIFTTAAQIDALKLNNDFLKMVRKLWFLISKKIQNLIGINHATDLQPIVDEIIANESLIFIETFSGETSKVSEVYKYKWFYDYYRTNYPIATR